MHAKWLDDVACALRGHRGGVQRLGAPPSKGDAPSAEGLRIVWPTARFVAESLGGWPSGASIPGREKNVWRDAKGGEPVVRKKKMLHRFEGTHAMASGPSPGASPRGAGGAKVLIFGLF